MIKRLLKHIPQKRKLSFIFLLAFVLINSLFEMLSVGILVPFLGVLTSPEKALSVKFIQPIVYLFNIKDHAELLLVLTVSLCLIISISALLRLTLLWFSTRLAFETGVDLGLSIYRRTLYQPYKIHCSRNSSDTISVITSKVNTVIKEIIYPTINLINYFILLVGLILILIFIEPVIILIAFCTISVIYLSITNFTRKKQLINSQKIAYQSTKVIKSLQEGLGAIRDILIDSSQETYCSIYQNAEIQFRRAQGNNHYIINSPRYIIEAIGLLSIIGASYFFSKANAGLVNSLPVIGALAFGAQRMLPLMQQIYSAWSTIRSGQVSFEDTLRLLEQPLPNYLKQTTGEIITFNNEIILKSVEFRYSEESPLVLDRISILFPKNKRIGIIGSSGCGKSTLIDIVMGLLEPSKGVLEVDGRLITPLNVNSWMSHIAHVPQNIFLLDASIEENIAFGQKEIDINLVINAAKKARIAEYIESLPNQYKTNVGERGVRLSGGQRQRIGIARALYKQSSLIVLDEATSALDNKTEYEIMESIKALDNVTVIIVAHRFSTLKDCHQIYELRDGKIMGPSTYSNIK